MNKIKIISRHSNVADAVKAAGLTRPSYENALNDSIRLSQKMAPKSGDVAFVVEPFSNSARIYGDKAEVITVCQCDIKLLNRLDIGGCLDDIGFQLMDDCGTHFELNTTMIPAGKRIAKSSEDRKWIARMQQTFSNVYASGLSYCG